MDETARAAQPARITPHESWKLQTVERALAAEFPAVPRRDVDAAVEAALAGLEPVTRRALVPQLVRDSARRHLRQGSTATARPLVRPMTSDARAPRSGAR